MSEPSKPKEPTPEKQPGVCTSNTGGTTNGGYRSRGPTPPISRASTPIPENAQQDTSTGRHPTSLAGNDVSGSPRNIVSSFRTTSAPPGGVVSELSVASVGPGSIDTAPPAGGTTPRAASVGPGSVNFAPPNSPAALRAASIDIIVSVGPRGIDLPPPAVRDAPRATSVEDIDMPTASGTPPSAASLNDNAAGVVKDITVPRAVSAALPRAIDIDIAAFRTAPAAPRAASVDAIAAPRSDIIEDVTVPRAAPAAPRAASAELPARQMERSTRSTVRLASGSIAVPSVQQLAAVESENAARKQKGGSTDDNRHI